MRSTTRFFCSAAASAMLCAGVWAQAPAAAPQRGGAARLTPGGSGPIRVLLITKGHAFDRAPFFEMFDKLGETITWTHVEQPSAQLYFDTKNSKDFDVFVFYDAMGRDEMTRPDGSKSGIGQSSGSTGGGSSSTIIRPPRPKAAASDSGVVRPPPEVAAAAPAADRSAELSARVEELERMLSEHAQLLAELTRKLDKQQRFFDRLKDTD